MGWIEMLSRTYDACSSIVGVETDEGAVLLPISHSTANAQIELTVDLDGNLVAELTSIVEKDGKSKVTVIPVTEDSAARGNGNFPHPLHDKLCYVAGDYSTYTETQKKEFFKKYVNGLEQWASSVFGNPWIEAVLRYVKKGTIIKDLVSIGLLILDEQGMLKKDHKFGVVAQTDAFIRFAVMDDNGEKIDLWKQPLMYESFNDYYLSTRTEKDLCYVTGRYEVCTDKHPSKIRNAADKAKLISGNDDHGFTYKGRFLDKKEALSVGYETSQKAHNALRWLIQRQGYIEDGTAVVAWKLPSAGKDGKEVLEELSIPAAWENTIQAFPDPCEKTAMEIHTGENFAERLKMAMRGYTANLLPDNRVVMMVLDAATTGRMSINYYHEFSGNEYIDRVIEWHENCTWKRWIREPSSGKYILAEVAPSAKEIVLAAFGIQQNKGYLVCDPKLMKSTLQRILPCIVGINPKIPRDIVQTAVHRASNPQAYSSFIWENQVFAIACAMLRYNRYKREKGRGDGMNLEKKPEQERSELFGRLLAIMDSVEQKAMYDPNHKSEDKRPTNAKKFWNMYTRKPMTTFERLNRQMKKSYERKLLRKTAAYMEAEVGSIINRLHEINGFTNKPLQEEYLIGYYDQKEKMKWNGNKNPRETDEEMGGNGNGNI